MVRTVQKLGVLQEAAAAGMRVVGVADVDLGSPSGALGAFATVCFFGGTLHASWI